ncbi:MAG: hypothetical protein SFY67_14135 [Candidatus Melainabacteria bacterium]|nr:hypothetical protein [Candidatus Melainabacteria bacterium]
MAGNSNQEVDNAPVVTDGTADVPAVNTGGFQAEMAETYRTASFAPSERKTEPASVNTGDIWASMGLGDGQNGGRQGGVEVASLPRDQQKRPDNIFEVPDNPNDQKISKDVDADLAKNKAVNEQVIKMGSDLIHAAVKEGNPKALAAEFAALVSNMNTFQNSSLDNGLRADALTAARLSAATLNQFSETISNESTDGKPVDINFDPKDKSMSITIGDTTMKINSRGMVSMDGVQMTPQEFLKKLKPASGGRDMV